MPKSLPTNSAVHAGTELSCQEHRLSTAWIQSMAGDTQVRDGPNAHGSCSLQPSPKKNLSAPCYKMTLKDFKRPYRHRSSAESNFDQGGTVGR
jgi:hypothetical protein